MIAPYYKALKLGHPPNSLDEFASASFYKIPQGAVNLTMYDHLQNDYHLTLEYYRSQLHSGAPRREKIHKDQIPDHVVQHRDDNNRLTTFHHLAVRDVEIRCQFNQFEVNKLGLVDVPGLGDTRLGDSELILETLGREVDAVLFFRRPDALGYQWDQDDLALYELADQALPDLSDRAFMVLNHQRIEGNNLEACEKLQKNTGKMKVVETAIVDCANTEEANQILDRVLQYLDRQILHLEEKYAQACQARLMTLQKTIHTELQAASDALMPFAQENQQFRSLFKQLMQNLANGLRDLVEELASEKDTVDPDFQIAVQKALDACETSTGIPSPDDIKNRCRTKLHNSYKAAYCVYVAELRAHISQNFLTLDDGLQQAANKLKVKVAKVLVEKAELGGLSNVRDAAFLDVMTELLAARQNPLESGFRTLSTFNVTYGELILNWIRRDLMDLLDSDSVASRMELAEMATRAVTTVGAIAATAGIETLAQIDPSSVAAAVAAVDQFATAATDAFFELNAETVHERLQHLHRQAVDQCALTLNNWLNKPSMTRYSMATEFVDRVLDAEDMEAEWDSFLREPEIRAKVWQEFGEIEDLKRLHQGWLGAVRHVMEMNQPNQFEFLN